jgi:hypothetical protein
MLSDGEWEVNCPSVIIVVLVGGLGPARIHSGQIRSFIEYCLICISLSGKFELFELRSIVFRRIGKFCVNNERPR